jgi:hypothetical protein
MLLDMLAGLGMLALFVGIFAGFVGGAGYWMLAPMHRATRESPLPAQFFVSDFIWLVAQLQIAIAAVMASPYDIGSFGWGVLLVGAAASVMAMWWGSVTALSRAGVLTPLRRATFTLVVVPVATVGSVATFVYVCAGILSLVQRIVMGYEETFLSWMLLLTLPTAAVFYATRRLNLWVLAGGERVATP